MNDNGKALFSIQKFLILSTKLNPNTMKYISDSYAYAWSVGIYPIFNNGEWHVSVKDYFDIPEEKTIKVMKYLDEEWLKDTCYSFYEIENYFTDYRRGTDIDRWDLICILRYIYLCDKFDDNFWSCLLRNGGGPAEANGITRKFEPEYDIDLA